MSKNTKAKFLLEDIDVDEISMTIGSGSATQKNGEMAYLCKGEDITLSEEEKEVLEDIVKSENTLPHEEFSPKEEVLDVQKTLEDIDSDIVSGSSLNVVNDVDNTPDTEINKNQEDIMTEEVKATEVTEEVVVKSADISVEQLEELHKSMQNMEKLLKAAEKEKEDIQKAAEAERIEKAKSDLTEVVKGWKMENTEEIVESLFKSGASSVLMKAMEDMHNRVETLKKSFGETEHGQDDEVVIKDDFAKSQEDVSAILKARKESRNNK